MVDELKVPAAVVSSRASLASAFVFRGVVFFLVVPTVLEVVFGEVTRLFVVFLAGIFLADVFVDVAFVVAVLLVFWADAVVFVRSTSLVVPFARGIHCNLVYHLLQYVVRMENLLIISGVMGLLLLIYAGCIFIIARVFRDNSVMDIAYGPAFLVSTGGTLYLTQTYELLPAVVVCCIAAWAVRLGSRILRKNLGKPEDARYAAWRTAWMERGRLYFLIRSFLQVNLLQIVLIFVIATPATLALSFPTVYQPWFVLAGLLVFIIGLTYETIADLQLDRFIAGKKAGTEPATLMTRGLFTLSRRPNYFGETLVWWGLAIMVLPLPFGWIALISPLTITYIVTRITGPMLERVFLEKYPEQYQTYINTTSYFIPWFKKRS